jgi:hypothetical protein
MTQDTGSTMPGTAGVEETVQRIRQLNERLLESARAAGQASLDAYEKALKSLVDFEQRVGDASQLEWVSALASAHAKFIQDVTESFTSAARQMLK